jgi:hypothetical protein
MVRNDELPDFESTEEDMHAWSKRWVFEGYELVCRYCGASQWPYASRKAFVHRRGCASDVGTIDLPWRDLSAIFRKACRRAGA